MTGTPMRMLLRDVLKSLLALPLVVLLALLLVRSLGDPTEIIMEEAVDQSAIQAMRIYLGLEKSLPEQIAARFAQVVLLDFGNSFIDQQPVIDILATRIGNSMLVMAAALGWLVLFCPLLGFLAFRYDAGLVFSTLGFSLLFAIPPLVVAVGVFYPAVTYLDVQIFESRLSLDKIVLAGFCMALPYIGFLSRLIAEALLDHHHRAYADFARMKGLSDRQILFRHVARNVLIGVLATANIIVVGFFTGSLVVERVFNIKGLGDLIVEAAIRRDYIVLEGVIVVVFVFLTVLNLLLRFTFVCVDRRYSD